MKQFLEAGTIVNTHGIRGEVRLLAATDSPDFLLQLKTVYMDGAPWKVKASRVHKSFLLMELEGVEDINAAMKLKGKKVQFDREDVKLEPGAYFLDDLVGLAVQTETEEALGVISQVLRNPTHDVLVVQGEREILIPDVPAFVLNKNWSDGIITVRLIEGM